MSFSSPTKLHWYRIFFIVLYALIAIGINNWLAPAFISRYPVIVGMLAVLAGLFTAQMLLIWRSIDDKS